MPRKQSSGAFILPSFQQINTKKTAIDYIKKLLINDLKCVKEVCFVYGNDVVIIKKITDSLRRSVQYRPLFRNFGMLKLYINPYKKQAPEKIFRGVFLPMFRN